MNIKTLPSITLGLSIFAIAVPALRDSRPRLISAETASLFVSSKRAIESAGAF